MAGHVHSALTLFFLTVFARYLGEDIGQSQQNRRRIGIKGLGQFISDRAYVMLSVRPAICKLSRLLSIGHSWPWRQDRFQKCSCSSIPTPTLPHIHPHTHAQPASIQWAMKQTFIFCLCTSFFIPDEPHTSPCSPHLAV